MRTFPSVFITFRVDERCMHMYGALVSVCYLLLLLINFNGVYYFSNSAKKALGLHNGSGSLIKIFHRVSRFLIRFSLISSRYLTRVYLRQNVSSRASASVTATASQRNSQDARQRSTGQRYIVHFKVREIVCCTARFSGF